ncbi:sulfurtransferase complex subunit TusB [Paraferrimonas haliotis]|uniref:sulfurtransferase complex subunit TusB n=1 Tax=Paraferrimonas haliotis TaxID=2013866 RepID=UPI000BA97614|nr:sulfurtransferase complex subunit TusB [Paraferrimonas haliotis]
MILHRINTAHTESNGLDVCLTYLNDNDTLVLAQNAVVCACMPSLKQRLSGLSVKIMSDDLSARGLQHKLTIDAELIDDRQFVELCASHNKVITW